MEKKDSKSVIEGEVYELISRELSIEDLKIVSSNGRVTIGGWSHESQDIHRAEVLIRNLSGVEEVVNKIVLVPVSKNIASKRALDRATDDGMALRPSHLAGDV